MSAEIIYIAGRYNKYLRNLSQSPWIDKNDVRVMNSVQEMIEDGFKEYLSFEKSIFASSGREDVDVRMLGRGRPFALKLHNSKNIEDYNEKTLRLIEKFINNKYRGKVGVRDLQLVSKLDVSKNLSEGQEYKKKAYRALCCCSRKVTDDDINRIDSLAEICLSQKTPIRVLHRRTLATRRRTIHKLEIIPLEIRDFDNVKSEHIDNLIAVSMLTEAGTYIKEFVHGDFGRTQPSLSTLLGDCDTDLMELDVMEIQLDWPPSLEAGTDIRDNMSTSLAYQEDKLERSDESLAELYSSGLKSLQEALKKERSDSRENLLVEARRSLEKATNLVQSLSLFSGNETIEDIATVNLKYLLIPAYLGKVCISGDIGSRRLEAFSRAEDYMEQFLKTISMYGFGNDHVSRALNDTEDQSDLKGPRTLEDQARIRQEKIDSFKKAQELERKLAELESRLQSEVDEEVVREYHIDLINKWINDTLDDLEGIVKPALMFERSGSSNKGDNLQRPPQQPCKNLAGKNFIITKDALKKKVFGTGYPSLPTVSVDQFITKKINDGDLVFNKDKEIYSNSLQRYAEQPDLRREQDDQSEEEHDLKEERDDQEELVRKRQWDEFKDDNPRGSGNRYNMG